MLTVSIEFGDGSTRNLAEKHPFAKGEVVVDKCYESSFSVKVSGNKHDDWVGTFEFSMSGESHGTSGSIWTGMICSDGCIGELVTMPIRVDGDATPDYAREITYCVDGIICTLKVCLKLVLMACNEYIVLTLSHTNYSIYYSWLLPLNSLRINTY